MIVTLRLVQPLKNGTRVSCQRRVSLLAAEPSAYKFKHGNASPITPPFPLTLTRYRRDDRLHLSTLRYHSGRSHVHPGKTTGWRSWPSVQERTTPKLSSDSHSPKCRMLQSLACKTAEVAPLRCHLEGCLVALQVWGWDCSLPNVLQCGNYLLPISMAGIHIPWSSAP
ncbi:hypothetical protein EDD16DRAFT_72227 [Pisolithus croceorrhizus]|nr:hypothetical protein EDD16DRAFT_72227 [Pisolithus croceorrhizus]